MDILGLPVITAVIAASGLWMATRKVASTYPPDDGPLSVAGIEHIRAAADPLLPKGMVLVKHRARSRL